MVAAPTADHDYRGSDSGGDSDGDGEPSTAQPHFHVPPPLPSLSEQPSLYPASCLALSRPLLAHISTLCQATSSSPSPIVSVGSGHGLLEALLLAEPYSLDIVGVEVQPSPNRYLPASHHRTVTGTRFLDPLAAKSAVWLFVYPRRVGLVEEYLVAYGDSDVKRIVWIGPTVDWSDYKACFDDGAWCVRVSSAEEAGGRAWESIAVATRARL